MLNIFSCHYWPFVHLLWRNVHSIFARFKVPYQTEGKGLSQGTPVRDCPGVGGEIFLSTRPCQGSGTLDLALLPPILMTLGQLLYFSEPSLPVSALSRDCLRQPFLWYEALVVGGVCVLQIRLQLSLWKLPQWSLLSLLSDQWFAIILSCSVFSPTFWWYLLKYDCF